GGLRKTGGDLGRGRAGGAGEFRSPGSSIGSARLQAALHRAGSVALEAAVLASVHRHAMAAHRTDEQEQAVLLVLIEALVKRTGRIGEALEIRGGLGHGVGARAQTLDRIRRTRLIAPLGPALVAVLGEIAD